MMVAIWRHGEAGCAAVGRLWELTGRRRQGVSCAALELVVVAPAEAALMFRAVAPRYELAL